MRYVVDVDPLLFGTVRWKSRTRGDLWPSLAAIIHRSMWSKVFLRSYVDVARPIEEVEAEMAAGVEKWMPDMAKHANGDGEKLLSELGFNLGKRRIGRRIKVEIGAPRAVSGLMFMPIRWESATEAGLFPTLEGVLEPRRWAAPELNSVSAPTTSHLLGLSGKSPTALCFTGFAEVTVKDFLERISALLERNV